MARIFISYSSKDRNVVTNLATDLQELGHEVWFDRELSQTGGQKWWSNILSQIRNCDIFLFALTPASLGSDPCQREYRYAYALNKPLVPVMLAAVDIPSLPVELQEIQFIDYREHSKRQALNLGSSLTRLQPRPLPDPLPPEPDTPLSPTARISQRLDAESLTATEQIELAFELETLLSDPITRTSAENLLRRLHDRPDITAKVADKIRKLVPKITRPAKPAPEPRERKPVAMPKLPVRGLIVLGSVIGLIIIGVIVLPRLAQNLTVSTSPTATPTSRPASQPTARNTARPTSVPTNTRTPRPVATRTRAIIATATVAANTLKGKLAFVSRRDGNYEIYVINADGTGETRLTNNAVDDESPSWSPDGKQIVYTSGRYNEAEVYVMDSDGSNQKRLTTNKFWDHDPVWSPDGSYIAFVSGGTSGSPNSSDIYRMNVDGTKLIRLTINEIYDYSPSWSPDSTRIVYTSQAIATSSTDPKIIVMNNNGTKPSVLIDKTFPLSYNRFDHLAWSPDGSKIIFSHFLIQNINVMDANGANPKLLIANKTDAVSSNLSWSPDSTKIAFASSQDGDNEIYIMNADGTNPVQVTKNSANDIDPAWSP